MKKLLKDTDLPTDLVGDLTSIGFQYVDQLYEALIKDPYLMVEYLIQFNLDYEDLMKQVMTYL